MGGAEIGQQVQHFLVSQVELEDLGRRIGGIGNAGRFDGLHQQGVPDIRAFEMPAHGIGGDGIQPGPEGSRVII